MSANAWIVLLFTAMTVGLTALAWRIHKRPAPARGFPKDLRILACLAFAFVGFLGLLSIFLASIAR